MRSCIPNYYLTVEDGRPVNQSTHNYGGFAICKEGSRPIILMSDVMFFYMIYRIIRSRNSEDNQIQR